MESCSFWLVGQVVCLFVCFLFLQVVLGARIIRMCEYISYFVFPLKRISSLHFFENKSKKRTVMQTSNTEIKSKGNKKKTNHHLKM